MSAYTMHRIRELGRQACALMGETDPHSDEKVISVRAVSTTAVWFGVQVLAVVYVLAPDVAVTYVKTAMAVAR